MQFEELLCTLRHDYPDLVFKNGKKFMYRPPHTIYFEQPLNDTIIAVNTASGLADQPEQKSIQKLVSHTSLPFFEQKSDLNHDKSSILSHDNLNHDNYSLQLLHEVGHALLKHRDYATDPERVKMERAAWEQARQLCDVYNIYYDEEFVEAELDTYRDWLHQRSKCKKCGLTCYQLKSGIYRCPRCDDLLAG